VTYVEEGREKREGRKEGRKEGRGLIV